MPDVLPYWLLLIAAILAGVVIYPAAMRMIKARKELAYQGVVKRDWLPTGRIDFAADVQADSKGNEIPSEFKLLIEEHRIVESVAGNENLEIHWRLATLTEAKTVVSRYHKFLSDNSLIKSVRDEPAPSPPPQLAQAGPSEPQ